MQRAECEAAVARHLAFADRLLADKDEQTRQIQAMVAQIQSLQDMQVRTRAPQRHCTVFS